MSCQCQLSPSQRGIIGTLRPEWRLSSPSRRRPAGVGTVTVLSRVKCLVHRASDLRVPGRVGRWVQLELEVRLHFKLYVLVSRPGRGTTTELFNLNGFRSKLPGGHHLSSLPVRLCITVCVTTAVPVRRGGLAGSSVRALTGGRWGSTERLRVGTSSTVTGNSGKFRCSLICSFKNLLEAESEHLPVEKSPARLPEVTHTMCKSASGP